MAYTENGLVVLSHFGRPIEYTEERVRKLADELEQYMAKPANYWLKGFAIKKGIPPEGLSRLAEKHEYFRQALARAKAVQEHKIADKGLKGSFNAQMAKFALTNVAGWREQGQVDVTSGGNPLGYVALPALKADADVVDAEIVE